MTLDSTLQRSTKPAQELIDVILEGAGRDAPHQQLAQAAAGVGEVGGQPVHLQITPAVEDELALRIEHQEPVAHVIERGVETDALRVEALVHDRADHADRQHHHRHGGDRQRQHRRVE
jgi:hypothetical protein